MVLPAKITGFYDKKKDTPPPLIDAGRFGNICQRIAEATPFRLLKLDHEPGKSFYFALLAHEECNIAILCNRYYPLVAYCYTAAPGTPGYEGDEFTDLPELDAFFTPDFTVLKADFLHIPLDADNEHCQPVVQHLTYEEFAQLAYWQPATVGELIFNRWQ